LPCKVRKIKSALIKKGFMEDNRDHKAYFYLYEGKKTSIATKISHGAGEYSDELLSIMKKELELSKKQFIGVLDCSVTGEDLKNLYIDKGIIEL